jgi:predicted esterase
MKALYIHGFQSSPVPVKVAALEEIFGEVIAPHIDWEDDTRRQGLFQELNEVIKSEGITHVIGSSMGGQMTFYLATRNNIDALCFNPAFGVRYDDFGYELNKDFDSNILIVLGKNDDVVDPERSYEFLRSNGIYNKVEFAVENMGHQISLPVLIKHAIFTRKWTEAEQKNKNV